MKFEIKDMKKALFMAAFLILFYWAVFHFGVVAGAIRAAMGIIFPFILGGVFAFILNVLMSALEDMWDKLEKNGKKGKAAAAAKAKRPVCLVLSFAIVIGMVFIIFSMFLPEIGKTATLLMETVPVYLEKINELPIPFDILPTIDINWDKAMETVAGLLGMGGKAVLDTTVGLTSAVANGVVNIMLATVFSIYLLLQKESLGRQARKVMKAYLPKEWVENILYVANLSNQIFTKYVTGQVTEAFIIGILCFLGMTLLTIPYAFMVSVLVGVTALIPMFGAFIGTAVGAFLILMVKPIKAVWFIIFIIVLQQVEGNLIYPRVVGKSVGLPGIWVLCAVTVGGGGFGLPGMLIGVPVCSVLYCLLKEDVNKKVS